MEINNLKKIKNYQNYIKQHLLLRISKRKMIKYLFLFQLVNRFHNSGSDSTGDNMDNLSVISGKWSLVTFANNTDLHEEFYIFECNNYTKCVTNSIFVKK
jgi:hypothetical protein